jgi:hypothetical protein
MRTVSKVLFALCLFWNVGAVARQPYLPDPELTPGDVFDVTITDICTPGYSKTVRAVPKYLRDQAFRGYGIEPHRRGDYQLDHLIPLAIGGSNSVRNLWPQPHHASPWDARAKDRLENRLHRLVCTGNSISKPRSKRSRLTGRKPTGDMSALRRSQQRRSLRSR